VRLRRLVAGRSPVQVGSVARNMVVVGGATAIGQGALVLASPLLTRLYDPQAFGLLSVYSAVLSVLGGWCVAAVRHGDPDRSGVY
jgi:hypothetical protein